MKISPKKDYKKPLYAAAVTVVAAATAIGTTGCPVAEKEEEEPTTSEELALAGEETVDPFYTEPSEVELDGDVVCPVEPSETEELILDGETEVVLNDK